MDLTLDLANAFMVPGAGWVFEFVTNAPLDADPPCQLSVFATRKGLNNPAPQRAAGFPGHGGGARPTIADSFTTSSLGITRHANFVLPELPEGNVHTPPRVRELGAVRGVGEDGVLRVGVWVPTPALQRLTATVSHEEWGQVHHIWTAGPAAGTPEAHGHVPRA